MLSARTRIRPLTFGGLLAVVAMLIYLGAPPPRAQAAYSQRIRAGSTSSFVDSSANIWSADRAYAPGGFGYTSGDPYSTGAAIGGTPDGPLFQTNRHAS